MSEEGTELRDGRSDARELAGNGCPVVGTVLGLAGAVAGGILGYLLFMVIVRHGFYAIVLPGALVGIGCGALSGRKSTGLGIACAILGLAAGIFAEWRFRAVCRGRKPKLLSNPLPQKQRRDSGPDSHRRGLRLLLRARARGRPSLAW